MKEINELEKNIKITFKSQDLLRQAMVHRSYLNEHPEFPLPHNERLEFLGDAVLELVVTEYLYAKYPNPEGDLTNWRASLVNSKMLAQIAQACDLNGYLYLSKGESKDANSKARQFIMANAFEALIGAIYLDQGWESAKKFIHEQILFHLEGIIANKAYQDPKSRFQELSQENYGITPSYQVLSENGPDHAKNFVIGLFLGKERIATGEGLSKQEAQVAAAEAGLKVKNW
ncbi:MAG: ribonuclease III [Patescibacteria group bacterium]